jgi:hypothetical protein
MQAEMGVCHDSRGLLMSSYDLFDDEKHPPSSLACPDHDDLVWVDSCALW